ncbi:MAG: L-seryl-tRNA(Sec) selenium transferase [Candidatus Marinimicrobia bacterium]|nr:L-seryl-tRNA(Sec) selenium transferase [Candidatus Neomarinimicrobiota bacterium]MCF7829605.1 L-seryl-tRNA(Sec) selenium transferase [Candidatus Neomarinimicrobiota bacterium]MCF7879765.1 L-seryl-tRNA(Sec) selenium transferase [Candidatus Neomarinimicrobiota bacterium]
MANQALLKQIPSVDTVLDDLDDEKYNLPREFVLQTVRTVLGDLRTEILDGKEYPQNDLESIALNRIKDFCKIRSAGSMQSVVNATGIVLHTGLGRAPLSTSARDALSRSAEGYCNLEFDLESGQRGQRNDHIEDLLCALTGADAGLMVNNNAAAVMLSLNTLAEGGEAIISRGQLVEIGGSFRIPDVMAKSGAVMVEVGTTNRTHLRDYENAITDDAAMILIAHTSNYKIEGFTATPDLRDILSLAHANDLPVMYDLGSGALFEMEQYGLPHEHIVSEIVEADVDVVTFSGDKLIGGPQAGLIVGKKQYVDRIKRNPMTRALRCDKLIYSAMEATLQTYTNPEQLPKRNTTYTLLTQSMDTLEELGEAVLSELDGEVIETLGIKLTDAETEAGSGSLPTEKIPGKALVITSAQWSAQKMMRWMRRYETPVVGYISEDKCFFNLRAVMREQIAILVNAFTALAEAMDE